MRKLATFFILLISCVLLKAQFLVSTELIKSIEKEEIMDEFGIQGFYDVDVYKTIYNTPNIRGEDDIASGIICVPKDNTRIFPLMIAQHGTVDSRMDCPSNLRGHYELAMGAAALGYYTVMPDLLGLGVNAGVHPFCHWRSEATASRDLIRASREFADSRSEIHHNDQVFIMGYSQGGHSALAVHKLLELEHADEFDVIASAPMSGPYSISDKMIESSLGEEEYFFCAYLARTTLSMKVAYPIELADYELEDIFKAQYVQKIRDFENEEITMGELNNFMQSQLIADVGLVTPKDMLHPEILDAIKNNPSHPLSIALEDNDLHDWAPKAPTRLMYCTADDQVSYLNSIKAEEEMNALGAVNLLAVENGETLDHNECVGPAVSSTIFFFLIYRDISLISAVNENEIAYDGIKTFQQGGSLNYIIDDEIDLGSEAQLVVYDMNGAFRLKEAIADYSGKINISTLSPGIHVLGLRVDSRLIQMEKVIIHN